VKQEVSLLRIVVSLPDQENEYQLMQAADAHETGRRLGLNVEVLDAESSPVLQIQQIFKATRTEPAPRAIIVEPFSSEEIGRVARHAVQSRVPVVFLNSSSNELPSLREEHPEVPLVTVTSDQVEIGRMQGRQLRAVLPTGGHVLYIQGPATATASQERHAGLFEALAGSRIKVTTLDGHWTESSAFNAVKSWLRLKLWETTPIDAVAAQDDSMARGARRAVEGQSDVAERWSRVEYLGIDGVPDVGQRMVDDGNLAATIVMPSNTGPALESIHRYLTEGARLPPTIVLPTASYPDEVKLTLRRLRGGGGESSKPRSAATLP
jgi:ABC-type sugar transport system substrate-binding protein